MQNNDEERIRSNYWIHKIAKSVYACQWLSVVSFYTSFVATWLDIEMFLQEVS